LSGFSFQVLIDACVCSQEVTVVDPMYMRSTRGSAAPAASLTVLLRHFGLTKHCLKEDCLETEITVS
jgi:hypothetical protein